MNIKLKSYFCVPVKVLPLSIILETRKMIKTILNRFILALVILSIASCETDIDLISDEGDSTVVFALLDPDTSIQFIKINKTFVGEQDAAVLAQDPSSLIIQKVH